MSLNFIGLFAGLVSTILSPTIGQAKESSLLLHPGEKIQGSDIDYDLIWKSVQLYNKTPYGSPFLVQMNESHRPTSMEVSYSQFDGLVVRVPLRDLLLQPNREGVDIDIF